MVRIHLIGTWSLIGRQMLQKKVPYVPKVFFSMVIFYFLYLYISFGHYLQNEEKLFESLFFIGENAIDIVDVKVYVV